MSLIRAALAACLALAGACAVPVLPGQCRSNSDCASDEHCTPPICALSDCGVVVNNGVCSAGAPCRADADCAGDHHCDPAGFCALGARCASPGALCASSSLGTTYCQADPSAHGGAPFCQPRATADTCLALAPALVASDASACVPSDACATVDACRDGERCLDAQCRASPACATDDDCGANRGCARGECFFTCDQGQACPDGTACAVGSCEWLPSPDGPCAPRALYYQARCRALCNRDADCTLGFFCDEGLCRLDDRVASARPTPACAVDTDCATGSRCLAGGCRAACPGGTDAECQRADVTLTRCDAQRICRP